MRSLLCLSGISQQQKHEEEWRCKIIKAEADTNCYSAEGSQILKLQAIHRNLIETTHLRSDAFSLMFAVPRATADSRCHGNISTMTLCQTSRSNATYQSHTAFEFTYLAPVLELFIVAERVLFPTHRNTQWALLLSLIILLILIPMLALMCRGRRKRHAYKQAKENQASLDEHSNRSQFTLIPERFSAWESCEDLNIFSAEQEPRTIVSLHCGAQLTSKFKKD